jgi:hypothetical protein
MGLLHADSNASMLTSENRKGEREIWVAYGRTPAEVEAGDEKCDHARVGQALGTSRARAGARAEG